MDNSVEKVAKLEEKVGSLVDRVNKLEDTTEILHKMEVLLEMQIEAGKDHTKQLDSFESTLVKVNENLSNLNRTQIEMQNDISSINNRIEKVEKGQEEIDEKSKIDYVVLGKNIIKALFMIIPTLISGWLAIKLGIK